MSLSRNPITKMILFVPTLLAAWLLAGCGGDEVVCPPGQSLCNDSCVNTRHDPENCGSCGTSCAAGEVCAGGSCTLACSAGLVDCSGACVATNHDPNNCGGCGTTCSIDERCDDSLCVSVGYVDARAHGSTLDDATIRAAVIAIDGAERTLYLAPGIWSISSDLTIPDNVNLKPERGAILDLAEGVTLTIAGSFEAGLFQVFSGTGIVTFGPSSISEDYPEWWGAKGDYDYMTGEGTDSTAAINAALAAYPLTKLVAGRFLVKKTLLLPANHWLVGSDAVSSQIYPALPAPDVKWIEGYVVLYNSTDAFDWVIPYPHSDAGMENIGFRGLHNGAYSNTKALFIVGGFEVRNCVFYQLKGGVHSAGQYSDGVRIIDSTFFYFNGAPEEDYAIDISSLGDARTIERVHISGGTGNGLRVARSWGGNISSCIINQPIILDTCESITINNLHSEGGGLNIFDSNVTIRDSYITKSATGPTISIANDLYAAAVVNLSNVHISVYQHFVFENDQMDIDYDNAMVSLDNVYRRRAVSGAIDHVDLSGILVSYKGTPLDSFNNYSHLLSTEGALLPQSPNGAVEEFHFTKTFVINGSQFWYPFAYIQNGGTIWQKQGDDQTPYYYRMQSLVDPVRMIGLTSTDEGTVAVSTGDNGVIIPLGTDIDYAVRRTTLRIYRGPNAGSYDEYLDYPMIDVRQIPDNGVSINGFIWKTRAAGPVDSVVKMYEILFNGSNVVAKSNGIAAPAVGTWTAGDRVEKITPASGSSPGWICTEGGTPGTWIALPNLP